MIENDHTEISNDIVKTYFKDLDYILNDNKSLQNPEFVMPIVNDMFIY